MRGSIVTRRREEQCLYDSLVPAGWGHPGERARPGARAASDRAHRGGARRKGAAGPQLHAGQLSSAGLWRCLAPLGRRSEASAGRLRVGLPRALRPASGPVPQRQVSRWGCARRRGLLGKGLAVDCLVCHGGSIAGKSYVGLGNASLDYPGDVRGPGRGRGTCRRKRRSPSATSAAPARPAPWRSSCSASRKPDLTLRLHAGSTWTCTTTCARTCRPGGCSRRKRRMYHTGGGDARSVRAR